MNTIFSDSDINTSVITSDGIIKACQSSKICLRDNTDKLLASCRHASIPFLIFSAGCGDIITATLKHKEPVCWSDENMMVVSNMLGFDDANGGLHACSLNFFYQLNLRHKFHHGHFSRIESLFLLKEFKPPLIHTEQEIRKWSKRVD